MGVLPKGVQVWFSISPRVSGGICVLCRGCGWCILRSILFRRAILDGLRRLVFSRRAFLVQLASFHTCMSCCFRIDADTRCLTVRGALYHLSLAFAAICLLTAVAILPFGYTAVWLPLFGYGCWVTAVWLPLLGCTVARLFGYRCLVTTVGIPLFGYRCLVTPLFHYTAV